MYPEISESERFPLLTPEGRKLLHAMRQDPQAPLWNWPNGEQLNAAGLARVEQFADKLRGGLTWTPAQLPDWLPALVDFCLEDVPFYRRRASPGTPFAELPSCSRDDVASRVWELVPDSQPLNELIVFSSSGTTGHPARMPSHPAAAACGVPLLEHVAAATGVRFPRGPQQMALTNIAAYRGAYTTAIVIAWLQEAGCIRVNLSPEVWRNPGDCRSYLDRWTAPVMLGDPLSFAALSKVGIERPPQVMISSIMALSDSLAEQLAARYGCRVLDIYALTEAGIVAVKTERGHAVLPHDLYVEVLDEHDQPCPPSVRGEVTLSGGRNPFLPLLRFRTGDFAALEWHNGRPTLVGLEGRQPVVFPIAGDRVVHSMEVTRLLRSFPLVQYQLHQDDSGGFQFGYRGHVSLEDLRNGLVELLGKPAKLVIDELPPLAPGQRKVQVYRSACTGPLHAAS
jgi:phenylacetate-CoA ligase